jgi:hypothetical protein
MAGDDVQSAARDLLLHRLDPATARCAACAAPCPCPHANAAAAVLARAGHWDQPRPGPSPQTRPVWRRFAWQTLSSALQRRRSPTP